MFRVLFRGWQLAADVEGPRHRQPAATLDLYAWLRRASSGPHADGSCLPSWQRGQFPSGMTSHRVEPERPGVRLSQVVPHSGASVGGLPPPAGIEDHDEELSTCGEAGEEVFAAPPSVAFREMLEFVCETLPVACEPARWDKTPSMPGMPPLPAAPDFLMFQESEIVSFAVEHASGELQHSAASNIRLSHLSP